MNHPFDVLRHHVSGAIARGEAEAIVEMTQPVNAVAHRIGIDSNDATSDGKLPAYAWPGGYPMYYLDSDNSILCPECANSNDEDAFPIQAWGINWEDDSLYCDECSRRVASAYAE